MRQIYRFLIILLVLSLDVQASQRPEALQNLDGDAHARYHQQLDNGVEVIYLGVSGYLIRRGEDAALFAPSITNPGFLALNPVNTIEADPEIIEKYLPDVSDAQWVMVGHGHYDHLLDVPYIMQKRAPKAVLLGSRTVSHMVASAIPAERRQVVNALAADQTRDGEWIYNEARSMRVLAIRSEHSPHLMGVKIMQGTYDEDLPELPRTSFQWLEGQTFNYLLDFLNADGSVAFRIYYQDTASNAPIGFIPEAYLGEARVDLAIYCVGAFQQVRDYPTEHIRHMQPKHIVLGHWEDFFANVGENRQKILRFTDIDLFIDRVRQNRPSDADWMIPDLFAHYYFAPRVTAGQVEGD